MKKEYQTDKLKQYIENSELRIVNKHFHVRLSLELARKYDALEYEDAIKQFVNYIQEIQKLDIKYPANANPVFYLYLVPDSEFVELLSYPSNDNSGGKPVIAYDLDSFYFAYGESQNLCCNVKNPSISQTVNTIHELAHLVHSQFFIKNCFICEGFAEAFTLYTMGYETIFEEHRSAIKKMQKRQILSVKELLNMEKEGTFYNGEAILANKSCSFYLSYISSYLFVRGYIELIEKKFNLSKVGATQKFLEIVRSSNYNNEWLIFDMSLALDISKDELLNGTEMQYNIILDL